MPSITFIIANGEKQTLTANAGSSLMQAAVEGLVPGILGDCGGSCSCATCHVYVDEQWLDRLDPCSDSEAEMLEGVLELRPNSRLGCQIKMDQNLDGIVVEVPSAQF